MVEIVLYLKEGKLLEDKKHVHKVRVKSVRFWISSEGLLYKKSFTGPYLLCVHPNVVQDFLYELHEGICKSHIGGRSLAQRVMSQGYWWPDMQRDAEVYARKYNKCQTFSPLIHVPTTDLNLVTSPWPSGT